jgi:ATP-dependent RNA helicase DHX29
MSDALFDEDQAEAQWPSRRNQIAQAQAEKRQRNGTQLDVLRAQKETVNVQPPESAEPEVPTAAASPSASQDEEDTDMLGEMFSAVPDPSPTVQAAPNDADSVNVTLRDFGKTSGVSPRKVLEEAVRSRYPTNHIFIESIC